MNEKQQEKLDLIVTRAWDNVIANIKNGTSFSHWKRNPALTSLYDADGNPLESNKDFSVKSEENTGKNNQPTIGNPFQGLLGKKEGTGDKSSFYSRGNSHGGDESADYTGNQPEKRPNPSQVEQQESSQKPVLSSEKEMASQSLEKNLHGEDKIKKNVDWNNHPGRKYSYGSFTLKFISDNKDEINKRAKAEGVSPIALAMVIGDELQTRRDTFLKGKGTIDAVQDWMADDYTMADDSDIGAGNFRIGKAKEVQKQKGGTMNDMELQKYLLSDEGTIHFASLALKESEKIMKPHLYKNTMPDYVYNQHLVEGYRQGPQNRMNRRFNQEKEIKRKLKILKAPDALRSNEAFLIYGKDLLNAHEMGEMSRTPIRGSIYSSNYKQESRAEMLQKAIKEQEKELERFDKPMQTGVPEERSEFRHQQMKWILEGTDKNKYKDDLLWTRGLYPNVPVKDK